MPHLYHLAWPLEYHRLPGKALAGFVRFAAAERTTIITTDLALRWATLPVDAQPATYAARLCIVRGFARYCSAFWPDTEVPPQGLLPHQYRRVAPYIYTQQQVHALLAATENLQSKYGLRPWTGRTLFGLMSSTGLGISEALAVEDADVDLARSVLLIRDTKFGKTRYVPMHKSTTRVLRDYQGKRDSRIAMPHATTFFIGESGNPLSYNAARTAFHHMLRQIGLYTRKNHRRPRMHDLRHTFVVATVAAWYRRGVDVDARMPALSTYVGHAHVADTYWYLSATPELLRWTAHRVERAIRRRNHS